MLRPSHRQVVRLESFNARDKAQDCRNEAKITQGWRGFWVPSILVVQAQVGECFSVRNESGLVRALMLQWDAGHLGDSLFTAGRKQVLVLGQPELAAWGRLIVLHGF